MKVRGGKVGEEPHMGLKILHGPGKSAGAT